MKIHPLNGEKRYYRSDVGGAYRWDAETSHMGGAIGWEWIPGPRGRPTETRFQVPNMKVFNRGEGAFFSEGRLVVATTGDDRVLSYTPATNHLEILMVSDTGDVFVCEDGGNLELVVLPVQLAIWWRSCAAPLRVTG